MTYKITPGLFGFLFQDSSPLDAELWRVSLPVGAFERWVADFPTKAAAESYVAMITPVTTADLDAALAPPVFPPIGWPYPTTQGETT